MFKGTYLIEDNCSNKQQTVLLLVVGTFILHGFWGWSGGAMVLGKLLGPGRPTI